MVQEKGFRKTVRSVAAISRIVLDGLTCCDRMHSCSIFKICHTRRCVRISIQSFTEPCAQRADGKIVCNGVVITANCVARLSGPIRSDSHPGRRRNQ